MSELRTRAVLIGSLVDIGGTFIAGSLLIAAVATATGATTPEQLARTLDAAPSLQLATLALGLLMTLVGAYVAARLAPGAERMHAFAVGVISTLIGFSSVFASPESSPFWSQAAGLILTVPAAFAGGEIRRAQARQGRKAP